MRSNEFIMTPGRKLSGKASIFIRFPARSPQLTARGLLSAFLSSRQDFCMAGSTILHFILLKLQFRHPSIAPGSDLVDICAVSVLLFTSQHLCMKKIAILLCIFASMGFTVASENNTGEIAAKPVHQKIDRTYGYIETTSPQSYTITLQ